MAGTAGGGFATSFTSPVGAFKPNQVSTPYSNGSAGAYNQTAQNASMFGGVGAGPEVLFSGKHNGLCLYLGRILRLVHHQRLSEQLCPNLTSL